MEDPSAPGRPLSTPGLAPASPPPHHRVKGEPHSEGRYVPRGLLLQWHITERCNLRCAHCYQESQPACSDELGYSNWLTVLDQFDALLADMRQARSTPLPWAQLTVTGGEPFMHRDFPRLLEEIARRKSRPRFAVLTNGWFIDADRAKWLARLQPRFVQVSLDGGEETHDRIRGRGAFKRALAALSALRDARVRTSVSFTAHRGNFREFPVVVAIARRVGADRVWSDRLIPCGSGAELMSDVLSPAETREYVETIAALNRESSRIWSGRTNVATNRALQFLASESRPYRCSAGDSLLTLLPNGDVVPCRRMPIPVGNLRTTPLAEIYDRNEFLRRLRDPARVSRGCEPCAFRLVCRGGLRCLSYAVTGDPFAADPGCWLADGRGPTGEPPIAGGESPWAQDEAPEVVPGSRSWRGLRPRPPAWRRGMEPTVGAHPGRSYPLSATESAGVSSPASAS